MGFLGCEFLRLCAHMNIASDNASFTIVDDSKIRYEDNHFIL